MAAEQGNSLKTERQPDKREDKITRTRHRRLSLTAGRGSLSLSAAVVPMKMRKAETSIQSAKLHKRALHLGVTGIVAAALTIPIQTRLVQNEKFVLIASILFAVVSAILWTVALCLETKARGHDFLWGLLLLFPPAILVYPFVFKDKFREQMKAQQAVAD